MRGSWKIAKKTLLANNCANESDTSDLESLHSSSKDEEVDEACSVFSKPTGNYIVCPDNLEQMLESSAVCKVCHSPLHIVEKLGSKQGLGAKWNFRCTNELCISRASNQFIPISPKSDKVYDVNRASVIGFRAIGK